QQVSTFSLGAAGVSEDVPKVTRCTRQPSPGRHSGETGARAHAAREERAPPVGKPLKGVQAGSRGPGWKNDGAKLLPFLGSLGQSERGQGWTGTGLSAK